MQEYSYQNDCLKLIDDEFGLNVYENFKPLRIPEEPKNFLALEGEHLLCIDRFSDGGLELAIYKSGLFDGEYKLTYSSGKIKLHCFYEQGKLHGPSIFFAENGTRLTEAWYLHGKQMGKCHWHYPSGNLYSIQRYLEDVWHGKQEFWYENGVLKTSMEYSHGTILGVTLYFPSGKLKRELQF